MKHIIMQLALATIILFNGLNSVAIADEEADRETLRAMLNSVEQAINDRDLTNVLEYLTANSTVVFQNQTVLTGQEEVQAFFKKMLASSDSILTDIKSVATLAAPASFFGSDTAVAHGTLVDNYSFRGGAEMQLKSVWTTTVARLDGQWRVASLHFSANAFDNPIIDNAKRFILWAALAGLLVGLLLTWLFMRRKVNLPPNKPEAY